MLRPTTGNAAAVLTTHIPTWRSREPPRVEISTEDFATVEPIADFLTLPLERFAQTTRRDAAPAAPTAGTLMVPRASGVPAAARQRVSLLSKVMAGHRA